jgi:hypothetical protein
LAEASFAALEQPDPLFEQLPQVIQQAQQVMMQLQQMMAPAAPPDPRIALEQAKIEQKGQTDMQRLGLERERLQARLAEINQKFGLEQQKFSVDSQHEQQRIALEGAAIAAEREMDAADLEARLAMNQQDNETAARITAAKIAAGQEGSLSTGTGINPNPQP